MKVLDAFSALAAGGAPRIAAIQPSHCGTGGLRGVAEAGPLSPPSIFWRMSVNAVMTVRHRYEVTSVTHDWSMKCQTVGWDLKRGYPLVNGWAPFREECRILALPRVVQAWRAWPRVFHQRPAFDRKAFGTRALH